VWLPPSQFEAMFLGTAHTAEVIEATTEAAKQAVTSLQETQPSH
jgi:glutamate-1-semialdehyde 2,1-aminomutase